MSFETIIDAFDSLNRIRAEDPSSLSEAESYTLKQLRNQIEQTLYSTDVLHPEADRREYLRIPITLTVRYWSERELRDRLVPNFSEGGLFIPTNEPFKVGTVFNLHISVTSCNFLVKVNGEVVWIKEGIDQEKCGMGIKFVDLNRDQRIALSKLVSQTLQKCAEPGIAAVAASSFSRESPAG